jgi:hypothetical protein
MGIHIGIGGLKIGTSQQSSWLTQRSLQYVRSGSDLLETFSGANLNAQILTRTQLIDASNYMQRTVADFGSATTRVPIEVRFYYAGGDKNMYLFGSSDESLTTKYFYVALSVGKLAIRVYNASPAIANAVMADNTLSIGWHTAIFDPTGNIYTITDNGVALTVGAGLTQTAGSNNGKWIEDVLNRDNITIGFVKRNSSTYSNTTASYIDYVKFGTTNKWVLTGYGKYQYDVIGGAHMTLTPDGGVASAFANAFIYNAGRTLLDLGYSVYYKLGQYREFVPYVSAGTPYDPSALLVGYTDEGDYAGDPVNLPRPTYVDSPFYSPQFIIGFNESGSADSRLEIFDRSNTTRQEDISRSVTDYNSASLATKCRYFSPNILYLPIIETLFKVGYKHRIFPINDSLTAPTAVTGFVVTKKDLT